MKHKYTILLGLWEFKLFLFTFFFGLILGIILGYLFPHLPHPVEKYDIEFIREGLQYLYDVTNDLFQKLRASKNQRLTPQLYNELINTYIKRLLDALPHLLDATSPIPPNITFDPNLLPTSPIAQDHDVLTIDPSSSSDKNDPKGGNMLVFAGLIIIFYAIYQMYS